MLSRAPEKVVVILGLKAHRNVDVQDLGGRMPELFTRVGTLTNFCFERS